ncbi:16S rRNA (cytidine(1402)-2'-O)-methyltransferase [Streptococcus sp. DD13]|uniref:16S rRNA (cytidine(1402)-2'-O)-methyltransferase n=1 Tax=Streptococcus sp. DD13 TaxID=1777881 RepID=UPI000794BCE7|nr:16S rRNA (cytidine(1402)-2'-O)-methyltransferase [Streptococcus sp. DD13]KXT78471.1 rRNA small subunit methyltransferase I [Streptococcus sp. DD13]
MKVQKSFKGQSSFGTLYLVPTPIGNLEDMTFRAIDTLKSVQLIAAEDTRTTGILLKHFGIETRQVSFHEHNAKEKLPFLIERLKSGSCVAQVSDAGLPSISDPGHDLVSLAVEEDIPVVALPGPSAGITALIASGLAPQPHIFYGFLPRKAGKQKEFFEEKKYYPETQIFYESPHRMVDTLRNMLAVYGNRSVVIVRELTKLYEEYQRGKIEELLSYLRDHPLKGECLLIVEGAEEGQPLIGETKGDPIGEVRDLIAQGKKPNQAIKEVAKRHQLVRQELYQEYHQKEGNTDNGD